MVGGVRAGEGVRVAEGRLSGELPLPSAALLPPRQSAVAAEMGRFVECYSD